MRSIAPAPAAPIASLYRGISLVLMAALTLLQPSCSLGHDATQGPLTAAERPPLVVKIESMIITDNDDLTIKYSVTNTTPNEISLERYRVARLIFSRTFSTVFGWRCAIDRTNLPHYSAGSNEKKTDSSPYDISIPAGASIVEAAIVPGPSPVVWLHESRMCNAVPPALAQFDLYYDLFEDGIPCKIAGHPVVYTFLSGGGSVSFAVKPE